MPALQGLLRREHVPNASLYAAHAGPTPDARAPELPRVAQLFRDHHVFVWRILGRLGVPREAVDDAVQDVFVVLHRRDGELDARGSIRGLLYGIARRVARRYRDGARRQDELSHPPASTDPGPDEQVARIQAAAVVRGALDAMDEDKRMTFVLADIEGMSVVEVAQCLNINLNTAYSRLRAARQILHQAIARHRARDRVPK